MDKNEEKRCRQSFDKESFPHFYIERDKSGRYVTGQNQAAWAGFKKGWEVYKEMSEEAVRNG